jgi:hypothetical protein
MTVLRSPATKIYKNALLKGPEFYFTICHHARLDPMPLEGEFWHVGSGLGGTQKRNRGDGLASHSTVKSQK